ncbi:hypothetical protein DBR14_15900 [Pseudomonas sp. HMWF034]|nr:hypothetical protein DBR14_15900 [Pseudomonas sp. HMWF034]
MGGRFGPFGRNAHQGIATQFVGDVPGLAQRNSHPGNAPARSAVVAAQIAYNCHHLGSAAAGAVLERPTVLAQAGIGKQQVCAGSARGDVRAHPIFADSPVPPPEADAYGQDNIAAVQIDHTAAQLQIEA